MKQVITLSGRERAAVEKFLKHPQGTREMKRAQALAWLAEGVSVAETASRLRVSRQSVYNWYSRFKLRSSMPALQRLGDAYRSGRPPVAKGIIDPIIKDVIDTDPRSRGYRSTVWTAGLLKVFLSDKHAINVSTSSVRSTIKRLGYRWKRPRYRLSLRPQTWRQSKGGFKAGSGAERELSR